VVVLVLLFAGGEYGGGASGAAGLRVGTVVENGLLGSALFLPMVIGDCRCNPDEFVLDAVKILLLLLFCDFFEPNLRKMSILED